MEIITNIITTGGFSALAVYLVLVAIPRIIQVFREDVKEQQAMFTQSLAEERKSFLDELRDQRTVLNGMRESNIEMTSAVRELKQEMSELKDVIHHDRFRGNQN